MSSDNHSKLSPNSLDRLVTSLGRRNLQKSVSSPLVLRVGDCLSLGAAVPKTHGSASSQITYPHHSC